MCVAQLVKPALWDRFEVGSLWCSIPSVCMHIVYFIYLLWYFIFLLCVLVNFLKHVAGLWFRMESSSNLSKHSFVFMQFRNYNTFSISCKKSDAVI